MPRSFCHQVKLVFLVLMILLLLGSSACLHADMTSLPEIEVFPKSENIDSLVPLNQQASGHISPLNLAQALAFAINGDYKVEDIYQSLPTASHTGVSLEDFRAYIKALTPAEGDKISSLVDLDQEAKNTYQDKVLLYQPQLADLALTSHYYRFNTSQPNNQRGKQMSEEDGFVLAIQVSSNGWGYLSPAWLKAVVDVQEFASFYFSALEDEAMNGGNAGSLAFLLEQDQPAFNGPGLNSYYKTKAEAISNYYVEAVTTLPKAAKASCLLPGYASYLQEYRYGGRLSGIREVEFYHEHNNFRVVEPIREALDGEAAKLLVYDQDIFTQSTTNNRDVLSSEDLHPLLGPLLKLEQLETSEDGKEDIFRASYYGLSFVLRGQINLANEVWQGSLESLELDSQIYSLGQNIYVGMPIADFYRLHPFYLDNNRVFRMNALFPEVRLDYETAGGVITKLILSRVS